jgi:hypothetical protein
MPDFASIDGPTAWHATDGQSGIGFHAGRSGIHLHLHQAAFATEREGKHAIILRLCRIMAMFVVADGRVGADKVAAIHPISLELEHTFSPSTSGP